MGYNIIIELEIIMKPEIRYGILYNQSTWQWNVIMWRRNDPLDAWQGQAVGGHMDQRVADAEAKRLNRGVK